jgi:hypothetical protein
MYGRYNFFSPRQKSTRGASMSPFSAPMG